MQGERKIGERVKARWESEREIEIKMEENERREGARGARGEPSWGRRRRGGSPGWPELRWEAPEGGLERGR